MYSRAIGLQIRVEIRDDMLIVLVAGIPSERERGREREAEYVCRANL